jgi:hypothetical protein
MGYFGKRVGRPVGAAKVSASSTSVFDPDSPAGGVASPHFAAQVGKPLPGKSPTAADSCPRCGGVLAEEDGFLRCQGRCERRWMAGGSGRWWDPAMLPFGACGCCKPRLPLVAAEVGAICPGSRTEYLILPEGVRARTVAAPLGICRCCLPPQPLVETAAGLVCRNKPQQRYGKVSGDGDKASEVVWLGLAPALDQAAVTAAIDAALCANQAELTVFGLFASPG